MVCWPNLVSVIFQAVQLVFFISIYFESRFHNKQFFEEVLTVIIKIISFNLNLQERHPVKNLKVSRWNIRIWTEETKFFFALKSIKKHSKSSLIYNIMYSIDASEIHVCWSLFRDPITKSESASDHVIVGKPTKVKHSKSI